MRRVSRLPAKMPLAATRPASARDVDAVSSASGTAPIFRVGAPVLAGCGTCEPSGLSSGSHVLGWTALSLIFRDAIGRQETNEAVHVRRRGGDVGVGGWRPERARARPR